MITATGLILLLVLLATGVPVALALSISGGVGLFLLGGFPTLMGLLEAAPVSSTSTYELIAVPMFILMANAIVASGISDELFDMTRKWVGRVPGGIAHATAITGALFGAISGSSTAAAATLASTTVPGMLKQGYDPRLATGVVAISGTLSMLIPPSVAMILYAILADISVAKLLIAGIVPGLLVTLTIILTVVFLAWRNPSHAPSGKAFTMAEKFMTLRNAWPFLVLFSGVTGVIYLGIGTPTEASGIGALAACLLALMKGTSMTRMKQAIVSTIDATCMIAFIFIGAHIFGYFLTLTQLTQNLFGWVVDTGIPPWGVVLIILTVYLVLGCIMDLVAMLILTVPIVAPMMDGLGYDPIWFAVVTIVMAEVGLVTPPLGMNVFVISKYTRMPVRSIFAGTYPHVVAHLLLVAVLVVFPGIVLWLPNTMH